MKNFLFHIAILVCIFATSAEANNLTISNVSLEDRNATAGTMAVQFDLRWDHSWRKDDGRKDAAWVFVKIYKNTTAPWIHGKLKTAGTNPVDTYAGSNADTEIIIPSDKIGAFIQRKATGNGTFSSNKIKLTVDLSTIGVSSSDTIQAKVFGIEMVYIPTGPFYIGDGDGQSEAIYAFHQNGVNNTAVQITTAAKSITVDSNVNDDIDTSPITVTGGSGITGNSSWPNGYSAFYFMKYQVSQQQYVDFLNLLTRAQQINRVGATVSGDTITNTFVMGNSSSVQYGDSIRAPASGNGTTNPITFGCDFNSNNTFNETGDGQAKNLVFAHLPDFLAYGDWAGLRPVTDLEYEKAGRGPDAPLLAEFAWGSSKDAAFLFSYTNEGYLNEGPTEFGESVFTSVVSASRVGMMASDKTNRKSANSGYYGNMDLNSSFEQTIVNLGNSQGRAFTGTHGDGTLTTTTTYEGNATNNDWPGINATTARGVTGITGSCYRPSPSGYLSDRSTIANLLVRSYAFSGRLGRTAP